MKLVSSKLSGRHNLAGLSMISMLIGSDGADAEEACTLANVLLIEDDEETAEEVALELHRCGHSVTQVASGPEGLSAARDGFDAMIVDRLLPGLEGLDVIKALRGEGVRTPALVVSALGGLDDRVRGLRAGGDDYLPKPFALVELVARLEALLRRPAETRETILRLGSARIGPVGNERGTRSGRPLDLQSRELDILEYLVKRPGRIVHPIDAAAGRSGVIASSRAPTSSTST